METVVTRIVVTKDKHLLEYPVTYLDRINVYDRQLIICIDTHIHFMNISYVCMCLLKPF